MIVTRRLPLHHVLLDLAWPMAGVLGVTAAVLVSSEYLGRGFISITPAPLTILGAALSIFLGFRNNTVWDRYWEARTLWGRLINASRTLIRQLAQFLDGPSACPNGPTREGENEKDAHCCGECLVRALGHYQIVFAHALRCHLRDEEPWGELARYLSEEDQKRLRKMRNVPAGLLQIMGEQIRIARRRGWLSDLAAPAIDSTLTEITDVLGGCERIKNTPLPPIYTYLAHKLVLTYCLMLPFGLVKELGTSSLLVVSLIAIGFLTLDRISYLIETPFSLLPNDLPLMALSRTIEIDVLQLLGEHERAPEPVRPVNGVLL